MFDHFRSTGNDIIAVRTPYHVLPLVNYSGLQVDARLITFRWFAFYEIRRLFLLFFGAETPLRGSGECVSALGESIRPKPSGGLIQVFPTVGNHEHPWENPLFFVMTCRVLSANNRY